jgi:hypothetical protein
MRLHALLLALHIAAGHLALVAAAAALLAGKGGRRHAYAGRIFTLGMAIVFATAVPMTLIRPNLFLFLVAIFSFYLALTGWFRARNRSGGPTRAERIAAGAMAVAAAAMLVRGALMLAAGHSMGLVLLVFGAVGGTLAGRDLLAPTGDRYRGPLRIAGHLTRMLSGTIAAITAFAVVNIRLDPPVIVWLAPTLLFFPVIVYWNYRLRRRTGATGARAGTNLATASERTAHP